MNYLLDTNHCIYLINALTKIPSKQKLTDIKVLNKINSLSSSDILYSCTIVLGELYYGAYKSSQIASNLHRVEILKSKINILDIDEAILNLYGKTKANLENKGFSITDFDLTTGSVAMHNNLILVTNDMVFNQLKPDLILDNWTA